MRAFLFASLVFLSYRKPSESSVGSSDGMAAGGGAIAGLELIGLLDSDMASSKGDPTFDGGFCGFVPSSSGKPYLLY